MYTTTLIATMVLPVVFLVGNDKVDASFVLLAGACVLIVAVSVSLLFVPKLLAVYRGTTDEWIVRGSGTTTVQGATTVRGKMAGSKSPRSFAPASPRAAVAGQTSRLVGTSALQASSNPGSPVSSPRAALKTIPAYGAPTAPAAEAVPQAISPQPPTDVEMGSMGDTQ